MIAGNVHVLLENLERLKSESDCQELVKEIEVWDEEIKTDMSEMRESILKKTKPSEENLKKLRK